MKKNRVGQLLAVIFFTLIFMLSSAVFKQQARILAEEGNAADIVADYDTSSMARLPGRRFIVTSFFELKAAIAAEASEIEISSSIEISETLTITASCTIKGGWEQQSLDRKAGFLAGHLFEITAGTVNFENLVFNGRGKEQEAYYGAIKICQKAEKVSFDNCKFVANYSNDYGSAICLMPENKDGVPELFINRCDFVDNRAEDGGALYAEGGRIKVMNSEFWNNSAGSRGGAVCINDTNSPTSFEFDAATRMYWNTADVGGAFYINVTTAVPDVSSILSSEIFQNKAEKEGGGIFVGFFLNRGNRPVTFDARQAKICANAAIKTETGGDDIYKGITGSGSYDANDVRTLLLPESVSAADSIFFPVSNPPQRYKGLKNSNSHAPCVEVGAFPGEAISRECLHSL